MIDKINECVGCRACVQVCPRECVSFSANGRLQIDKNKCIECGQCTSVCQNYNAVEFNKEGTVYAAICKAREDLSRSSSGGIAYLLYKYFIETGGVVFGVRYKDNFEPVYDYADDLNSALPFLKSKYAFSNVEDSYKKCKNFLEKGIKVLYVGLPCQIAGLKLFLKKKYSLLTTVDILCHGAPNYELFCNHIKYLQKKKKLRVIDYQFRDKLTDRFGPYHYSIKYENGICEDGSAIWDAYYNAFMKSDIFRNVCYKCNYSKSKRVSDITLGDFWKASETISELKGEKYISSIIINTSQGEKLIHDCKDKILMVESSMAALAESTHAVTNPSTRTKYVSVEELLDFNNYCRWASKYEDSIPIILRKIKNKILRSN